LHIRGLIATDSSLTINNDVSDEGFLSFQIGGLNSLTLDGIYNIGKNNTGSSFLGTKIINDGQATLRGKITNAGLMTNLDTAEWQNRNGASLEFVNTAGLTSGGGLASKTLINNLGATIRKTEKGTSSISWDVVDNGTINVQEGSLSISANTIGTGSVTVAANSNLTVSSNVFQFQTKDLSIDPTGTFNFNGSRLEVTNFTGNFNHTRGTYAPGASPAVSTLTGNYTMSGTSVLELELAGTTTGLFDQLFVSGDVNIINGSLSVSLLDGFTVSAGQTFDFLTLDGIITGSFTGLSEGSLVGNFGQDLFITYLAGDGNDIALFSASVVPVPPSVWLMGTGLLGLVGFSRRKAQVAA
jgi:hypothetical protein